MTLQIEIADQIQTMQLSKSKISNYLGGNIRTPSLVKGGLYIMRVAHTKCSTTDNPYSVVEFVGSGNEQAGVITWYDENPSIKDMVEGDHYFFKGVNSGTSKIYQFGAYMYERMVCIGGSAVRVTFYAVTGHEVEGNKPRVTGPKTPASNAKPVVSTRIAEPLSMPSDDKPIGIKVKPGTVCNYLTQRDPWERYL